MLYMFYPYQISSVFKCRKNGRTVNDLSKFFSAYIPLNGMLITPTYGLIHLV